MMIKLIRILLIKNTQTRFFLCFVCVSTIVIDSVCQMSKVHYPQVYLEVCKYTGKQMKTTRHITEAIIFFSSSFSSSDDDDSEDHNSERFILTFQFPSVSSFISSNTQTCHLYNKAEKSELSRKSQHVSFFTATFRLSCLFCGLYHWHPSVNMMRGGRCDVKVSVKSWDLWEFL